jgi:hypothetical protein
MVSIGSGRPADADGRVDGQFRRFGAGECPAGRRSNLPLHGGQQRRTEFALRRPAGRRGAAEGPAQAGGQVRHESQSGSRGSDGMLLPAGPAEPLQ